MPTLSLEYLAPATIEEVLDALAARGAGARILAGGTDLVVNLKRGKLPSSVTTLVSLKRLPLRYIRVADDGLHIGARATHHDVATSPVVAARFPLLAQASAKVGSLQIRKVATVSGNICNAGPSADTAGPLLALDVQLQVRSARGKRTVPLCHFYVGPSRGCLESDEMVEEILVPWLPVRTGTHYEKLSPRRAMDLAWVGVAVVVTLDETGRRFADARIGLSAVAPTPRRAIKAEAVLRGREVTLDLIREAGEVASTECEPNPRSRRVPAWYRRDMVGVMTARCLNQALGAAGFDGRWMESGES